MQLGVMVECQEGVGWDLWRRLVRATEDLGFESLWRSDHFFSLTGSHTQDALESFVSFAVAATESSRIRLGSLVCSMTFRHPSLLARMAAQIDQLSDGRFTLGVGAGWNVPEHEAFGLPFPPLKERMDRLEESIQVLRALWADGPASFEGEYYRLRDAECFPKPAQRPMPLLIGGNGEKRTLRMVARYADEWNSTTQALDTWVQKRQVLDAHCAAVGRDPVSIKKSQMSAFVVGNDEQARRAHLARIAEKLTAFQGREPGELMESLRGRGWLIGAPGQIVEELKRREQAGIGRVMLQHHANTDFAALESVARDVLPALGA